MPKHAMTLPADLPVARNGRLFPHELVLVLFPGVGMFGLHRRAARCWNMMALACWNDLGRGDQLTCVSAADVYRTFDIQERVFFMRFWRLVTSTIKRIYQGITYWKKPGVAQVATPGTSNHGWGLAIDVGVWLATAGPKSKVQALANNRRVHAWMLANAPTFGFYDNVSSEPWHWEFCMGDVVPQRVLDMEAWLGIAA
jgi:hypothetical protein